MLDPKIDIVFRKLFGSEDSNDRLISLINSVVNPKSPIVKLVIKNPYNLADYVGAKESILDIKAQDEDGTWYGVEMQIVSHPQYGKRAIYYVARPYVNQIKRGDDYAQLNTTIGIHFLDFNYFNDNRVLRHFMFMDVETKEPSDELSYLQLYFIEMPKFNKGWEDLQNTFERWVAVLAKAADLDQDEIPAQLAVDVAVASAVEQLKRMALNEREREIYDREVKTHMLDTYQISAAEERGMQQGIQQGIQQGMQQGIQQGMQQGMQRMVVQLIERRFGVVPRGVSDRLQSLDSDALDELLLKLLEFGSIADVEQWLTQH